MKPDCWTASSAAAKTCSASDIPADQPAADPVSAASGWCSMPTVTYDNGKGRLVTRFTHLVWSFLLCCTETFWLYRGLGRVADAIQVVGSYRLTMRKWVSVQTERRGSTRTVQFFTRIWGKEVRLVYLILKTRGTGVVDWLTKKWTGSTFTVCCISCFVWRAIRKTEQPYLFLAKAMLPISSQKWFLLIRFI